MQMNTLQQRLRVWCIFLGIAFLVVIFRLAYWQLWMHDELASTAADQYESWVPLRTQRGTIFDTNGSVLATNQELYTLFAEPHRLELSATEVSEKLEPIIFSSLEMTEQEATDEAWLKEKHEAVKDQLRSTLDQPEKRWVPVWSRLSREQRAEIESLGILGLGFDPHMYRYYPDASVSAHLLGFVGKNDAGEDVGYFGLEGFYDLELRGREGLAQQQRTALGLPITLGKSQQLAAQAGKDLVLTIDKGVQHQIEQKLLRGIERYGAKSGEVVVMEPRTGAIIAMASFPNYDPASFISFDPKYYRNPAVSDLYEPGSTMKVVTMAIGIESGAITPETSCDRCAGPRTISGFPIRTWNEEYNPDISMIDGLAKSDNTAMVFAQEQVGKERFLQGLREFGFAEMTGIDVQGEASYDFREDTQWRTIDVATASFGQGIATTSINLVRAVAAIANGGQLIQPHVVQEVLEEDGTFVIDPYVQRRVISEETAQTVTEMMVYTADQGDSQWTDSDEVKVAGKTGTAQIAEKGKYLEDATLTSFVGFAPADDPKFVMLVKLREPTSSPWGSETAAPLWYEILPLLL